MTIKFVQVLDGELAEAGWKLYTDAFTELAALAAQRHVMFRSEFDEVMADPRVDKTLTLGDGGELVGLATFTRDLDAVPLIAPAFFERRWPQLYAQRRIWYIGFVAVAPQARKSGAFTEVLAEYYRIAAAEAGMVGMDICTHNEAIHRLPQVIGLQVRRHSGGASAYERIDAQSYWMFDMGGEHLS